jgi:hypothetical protein
MFKDRTLFIVGAGASKEVGLPIGTELTKLIAKSLDIRFRNFSELASGDPEIVAALRVLTGGKDINPHRQSACQISAGMHLSSSIDSYLDMHKHDNRILECGKLGIAQAIMASERKSGLYFDGQNAFDPAAFFQRLEESWFPRFFKLLSDGISKSDLASLVERVSFICFNYDRCIEQFIVRAVASLYAVDDRTAEEVARALTVLHPYGTIGPLPWQQGDNPVPFGGVKGDPNVLLKASNGIRTFTERVEEGDVLEMIREKVAHADTVVFLGFSFQVQNMQLLKPPARHGAATVYGTALGISNPGVLVVQNQIGQLFSPAGTAYREINNGLSCSQLLDTFSRNLSIR